MYTLACNKDALLVKTSGTNEYWVIRHLESDEGETNWTMRCPNEQSESYNAMNALAYFEQMFGKATWKRRDLANF